MAFPTTALPTKVFISPGADLTDGTAGWVWTDITSSVRLRDGIQITSGRADESARVAPSICRLRLDNRTGDFTPRNPLGAYYGSLGRNTPLRVSIRRADDDFARTASSGWGTEPLWGDTWTVTGGSASDYSVSSGTGRQSLGTTNTWRRSLLDVGVTDARITVDVTNPVVPTGATISHGVLGRVTDTNNYYMVQLSISTAGAVTVALLRRVAGVDTSLTVAASVGTHSAGDTWRVVFDYQGSALRAKVWEPSGSEPTSWQVEATDTNLTTGSQVGLAAIRVTGNTNGTIVVTHDNFTVDLDRFTGFVSAWPPRWDKSGNDATVPIEANGVLRRLGQGASPLRSALFRHITTAATLPVAYWPLEDGVDSTQAASGLVGGSPMTVQTGEIDFIDAGPTGSAGAANLSLTVQGVIVGTVSGTGTAWQVGFWARGTIADPNTPAIPSTLAYVAPIEIHTSSPNMGSFLPFLQAAVEGSPRPGLEIGIYDQPGGTFITALSNANEEPPGQLDGEWHFVQITAQQVGADVDVAAYLDGVLAEAATLTGKTVGFPTSVRGIGISGPLSDVVGNVGEAGLSTVTVYDNATPVDHYAIGSAGHAGEAAHERIERLCDEEGVSVTVPAVSADFETPMGPQSPSTLIDLLYECADADQGVLHESGFGLGYLPREHRYNRAVDLALDFDLGQIADSPEPTDDDQALRNRVTVARRDGSRETAQDAGSIATVGLYDEEVTVNLADDSRLADHAALRLRVGTTDEMRWPRIDLNLAASPELIDDWLSCGIQSRDTAVNPPDQVAGDDIDVIIEGYTETLGFKDWDVSLNTSPAAPWIFLTDTFTRTVSNGWGTADTGEVWSTSGGSASDYSVNGSRGLISLGSLSTSRTVFIGSDIGDVDVTVSMSVVVLATGGYIAAGPIAYRNSGGTDLYFLRCEFNPGATITLNLFRVVGSSTSLATATATVGHSTGTTYTARLKVTGGRIQCRFWQTSQGEPGTWDIDVVDSSPLTTPGSVGVRAQLQSSNTNALPVVPQFDNFGETRL